MTYNYNSPETNYLSRHSPYVDNLNRAYDLAGLSLPLDLMAYEDVLPKQVPTNNGSVTETAREYAGKAETYSTPKAWVEAATTAILKAYAQEELRKAWIAVGRNKVITCNADRLNRAALTDLKPFFDATVKGLRKAAKALPVDEPFNLDAIFALDATREYKAAMGYLQALGVIASCWSTSPATERYGAVLPIVRVPACTEPLQVIRHTSTPAVEVTPERAQTRSFCLAAMDSHDLALIELARGDYPTLEFALPTESVATRYEYTDNALTNISVDDKK